MLLFYIRHGDPIYHPDNLTELGLKQANALSKRLINAKIDKIYSSDSVRAVKTAEPTAKLYNKEIILLPWANEHVAWTRMTVEKENAKLNALAAAQVGTNAAIRCLIRGIGMSGTVKDEAYRALNNSDEICDKAQK